MLNLTKEQSYSFLYPALLVLVNLILKLPFLNSGDISLDEPFTIFHAQMDLRELLEVLKSGNNPPFFYFLIHFWIKLFGISMESVRFLPCIFSSLTVLFIYKIGIKHFNIKVALISSLIFTLSNYHLYFSHETRVYSLFALLTAASMYSFLSIITGQGKIRHWVGLTVWNVLLIYSHFFGFLVLALQFLVWLSFSEVRKKIAKPYLLTLFITSIAYLPYLPILLTRFQASSGGTWVSAPTIDSLYNNIVKFSNQPVNAVFFLILLAAAFFRFIYLTKKNQTMISIPAKVIIIWFLAPYFFLFFISYFLPVFLDRYLVFISIGFYLAIGVAVSYMSINRKLFMTLAAGIFLLMTFTAKPSVSNNRDIKAIIRIIEEHKTPKTAVILCPEWIDLEIAYHYNLEYFKDHQNLKERLSEDDIHPINNVDGMDSILTKVDKIIFIDGWCGLVDKNNEIYQQLMTNFPFEEDMEVFKGMKIMIFSSQPTNSSLTTRFPNQLFPEPTLGKVK